MPVPNRSLGLAALGWWLAARGLSEPIDESFTRLEPSGVQRLGKASRVAALQAAKALARALRDDVAQGAEPTELFTEEAPTNAWVERLDTLLNTPRIGLKLEKALIGDSEDFDSLIAVELAEDRSVMLAARLVEWLNDQIGSDDEPEALAEFLASGWPVDSETGQTTTFTQDFLANLAQELTDAPAEITMPLGEPSEFLEWLKSEAGWKEEGVTPAHPVPSDPPAESIAASAAPSKVKAEQQEDSEFSESLDPKEEPLIENPRAAVPPQQPVYIESRGKGWLALLLQATWVGLLLIGWQAFQQYRSKLPPPSTATPPPASPSVVSVPDVRPDPDLPADTAPVENSSESQQPVMPAISPLPARPEMSMLPDELVPQALELASAGHHAEAVGVFRRIVQIQAQDKATGRLARALVMARLAASLAALERWDEADAVVERAQALLEELLPAHDAETALGLEMVADYWASRERWPLAARLYQRAVNTYEGTPAENSAQELSAVNRLAGALRQIGEVKRAEFLYRQLVKGYDGAGSVVAVDAASASHNLANLLLTTNRAGEARQYYEQALALLAKAPPEEQQAPRMALMMRANYQRCLIAMGMSAEEAQQKAEKATGLPAAPQP